MSNLFSVRKQESLRSSKVIEPDMHWLRRMRCLCLSTATEHLLYSEGVAELERRGKPSPSFKRVHTRASLMVPTLC